MPLSPTYLDDVKNVLLSVLKKKADKKWVIDVCPKCRGPTQHVCSWVCVDFCYKCDGFQK